MWQCPIQTRTPNTELICVLKHRYEFGKINVIEYNTCFDIKCRYYMHHNCKSQTRLR